MSKTSGHAYMPQTARAYFEEIGRPEHVFPLRPEKAALLVVDMQRFACDRAEETMPGFGKLVDNINALAAAFRSAGRPVIWVKQGFTRDASGDDLGLYKLFHKDPLPDGMFDGGELTELFHEMDFDPDRDHVVRKHRYSAFSRGASNIESLLAELGIEQLIVTGVVTNVCVESNVRDAMQLGYEMIVLEDAVASPFEEAHYASLTTIKLFFGDVRRVEDVLACLG